MYKIDDIRNTIIQGDALESLKEIPDESIDLIITSPPYYGLRNYQAEGQIGLEENFEDYLERLLKITAELKRVLKKTGQLWWNHGDCYGGNFMYPNQPKLKGKDPYKDIPLDKRSRNKKPKCLMMQPERLAIRMIDEQGWILRNKVVWCLDKDTKLLVKRDNGYKVLSIKDLEFDSQSYEVPALGKEGIKWVKIKNVWYSGKKEVFEIELTNGKKVRATAEHLFPTTVWNWKKRFIKLSFKQVKDLNKKYDKFYVATKIDREEKLKGTYKEGLLVGWYLAEGSGIWSNSNKKLTVSEKDLDKLTWLIKKWNLKVKKQSHCNAYDVILTTRGKGSKKEPLVEFLRQFIIGKKCGEKKFTDEIWNMSDEFLKGIIDGFCEGDGNWDKKNKRWRIKIKYNPELVEQLEIICLLVGKQFRKENNTKSIGFGKEWKSNSFSIQDWNRRYTYQNLSFQAIRSIKSIGLRDTYDIEIEPVYTTYCGKGKTNKPTKEKKKAKWNGIFFLANGILTHNCKQILIKKENRTIGSVMPTSVKDRFNESWEYLYFFTKSKKYYSNLDAVRLPPQTELNFERPRMGQGNQTIYEQKRAPGIIRQQYYPESKYNKFNYRVRDAKRKQGQPQFKASKEEIKKYQGKFSGMGEEEVEMFGSPRARNKRKRNKTLIDPNAKGLRQAPEPGEPNAFHPLGKNIPTVWQINPEPHNFRKELGVDVDHFAVFPQALVETPIKFGCPSDGIVLDPFCGSGTTLVVAKKLGRNYIGIELNSKYIEIAQKRLEKTIKPLL